MYSLREVFDVREEEGKCKTSSNPRGLWIPAAFLKVRCLKPLDGVGRPVYREPAITLSFTFFFNFYLQNRSTFLVIDYYLGRDSKSSGDWSVNFALAVWPVYSVLIMPCNWFQITDACSACFEQRTVFTQQVLAKALDHMVYLDFVEWMECF